MTRRLLIRNASIIATMNDAGDELSDASLLVEDGVIAAIWSDKDGKPDLPACDDSIDASGCVVTPGLINTHHHLYQTLTRAVPGAQDALLFGWLERLYPIWARMTPADIALSTRLGLAELALSGCTLSSDHLYLFPNGIRLDDTVHTAREVGLRFHATRGSMSIGQSAGGLPPDALVENEAAILADSQRVVSAFHETGDGAMVQVALAPCSPFSVSRELMRDSALLARELGVMLHTHLAENDEDVAYSFEKFGCSPGDYAQELGWTGQDVWHAHCVKLDARERALFGASGTGVAHCPSSNCRLGSGIAPIRAMRDAGVNVGLGVDGSASNDSGHLLGEARQALFLQRVANGADALSAREALHMATRGGAAVLGREDLGQLACGKRADIAIWDMARIEAAGAWDPLAALVLTGPHRVRDLFVEGQLVVDKGELASVNMPRVIEQSRAAIMRLAD